MPTRFINRRSALDQGGTSKQNSNPVFVDSDNDLLTWGTGTSGTSVAVAVDTTSAQTISGAKTFTGNVILTDITFELGDDDRLTLGDDNDIVLVERSATNAANTAITSVLIGTPVTQAVAANSLIVSNVTASGDILLAANRGGASEEYVFADGSAGTLTLTGPGGIVNFESGTTQVLGINSATVIEVADDVQFTLGNDNDQVALNRSATLAANTALTGALVGTPVTQALAANSLLISNITASGDVMIAGNRGGASEEYFMADTSAGTLTLTGPGGIVNFESGTTQVLGINSATVIEVGDDINFTLGADNDGVLRHKTSTTSANTAVTGVIVGTPVVPALAANSVVLSNITADGDIALLTQTGGNSQAALTVDASAGQVDLYAAGVSKITIDSTGARVQRSVEVVSSANVITAAESGRVYFLNSGTEFASTLPAPALGLEYTFIVTAAPSGASYTVVTEGGCQILAGHVLAVDLADSDSGTDVEGTATGTTISFVDGVSLVGDRAHVISDGTSWFASCSAGHPAGITITG